MSELMAVVTTFTVSSRVMSQCGRTRDWIGPFAGRRKRPWARPPTWFRRSSAGSSRCLFARLGEGIETGVSITS